MLLSVTWSEGVTTLAEDCLHSRLRHDTMLPTDLRTLTANMSDLWNNGNYDIKSMLNSYLVLLDPHKTILAIF